MTTTNVYWMVLQAALRRNGIWLVDASGSPTDFYHKECYDIGTRRMPSGLRPDLARFGSQMDPKLLAYFQSASGRVLCRVQNRRDRTDFGR